ncbi:hypothetical protein MFLO_04295 [Listeria floridensis FSL S10-1187]|uniref:Uncharacterized protein n=1 Tax=Listeria floridensis FSL S10-1187 TaxID=1265817 RepID=A0ABP3AZS7_9LIST|nr:hypothetical protein MFLO_04295 [Listeria floridensis FSL S10-1187]
MKSFIKKYVFRYRGKRIRYRTKNLLRQVGISIGIPTFLLVLSLFLWVFKVLPSFPLVLNLDGIKEYFFIHRLVARSSLAYDIFRRYGIVII